MMIPTVKIKLPHDTGDYATINESDFDPKIHERYEDEEPDDLLASDAAILLADKYGVDLTDVTGSGKGGNITKPDVQAYVDRLE
jgi:2-oxoisovalerate dehydrogenase E2 component (dihydrolipoyl transacylase)